MAVSCMCCFMNEQPEITEVKRGAAALRAFIIPYLLQFLGNTHACVNSLPALGVLCLIVLQEVASGELRANEACQRRIWNNVRAKTVLAQGHCLQQLQHTAIDTMRAPTFWRVTPQSERGGNFSGRWKLEDWQYS